MTSLLANQAIDLSIAALISAFAVLVGSVSGYIQLRGQQIKTTTKVDAMTAQVEKQDRQQPTTVVVTPGGGAQPLLELDAVNQRTAVSVGGGPASTGNVDCGLACVVSVIADVKRTWSADQLLRLRYFGVVDSRLTTADDIVGMLRANDIPSHARQVDAEAARVEIVRNWQAGRGSIVLGDWISAGYPHWMRFIGDDGGAEFMDPWIGGPRRLTWQDFAARYDGWYVHIDVAPAPALCA